MVDYTKYEEIWWCKGPINSPEHNAGNIERIRLATNEELNNLPNSYIGGIEDEEGEYLECNDREGIRDTTNVVKSYFKEWWLTRNHPTEEVTKKSYWWLLLLIIPIYYFYKRGKMRI